MRSWSWSSGGRTKDEAEKPFWISYADLMTALMMLFLIVMCVSLMSMINAQEGPEKERETAIQEIMNNIQADMQAVNLTGKVDVKQRLIDFGEQARFEKNSASVSPASTDYLKSVVPIILKRVDESTAARKWFKRVTVEGYTSQDGDYFLNLWLSLRRSHNVLCALLTGRAADTRELSEEQKRQIRRIFMVGGFSANSTTGDPMRDRRVEFRLEFWTVQEKQKGEGDMLIADKFDSMEVGQCQQQ
jgi:outer membrane protein OmpA-like peptidoglycan-associated protein